MKEVKQGPELQPQERNFNDFLEQRQISANTLLCVGLDPDYTYKSFPMSLKDQFPDDSAAAKLEFNKRIIIATYPFVCAFKLNSAFYECDGEKGISVLKDTVAYINNVDPTIPVIDDAKRGDIRKTNREYVKAIFDDMKFDATTINPYLGSSFMDDLGMSHLGAMEPFLERKDKGIIVLTKTSNMDSGEFQDLPVDLTDLPEHYRIKYGDMKELRDIVGKKTASLSQIVAYRVSRYWNINENCGLVIGATYPEELAGIRQIVGSKINLLITGLGVQGGKLEDLIHGCNMFKRGIIANISGGIISESSGPDFDKAAGKKAKDSRDAINICRDNL